MKALLIIGVDNKENREFHVFLTYAEYLDGLKDMRINQFLGHNDYTILEEKFITDENKT